MFPRSLVAIFTRARSHIFNYLFTYHHWLQLLSVFLLPQSYSFLLITISSMKTTRKLPSIKAKYTKKIKISNRAQRFQEKKYWPSDLSVSMLLTGCVESSESGATFNELLTAISNSRKLITTGRSLLCVKVHSCRLKCWLRCQGKSLSVAVVALVTLPAMLL